MKTNQMRTENIYLELAVARESATTACVLATQRQAEEGESFLVEKNEGFRYILIGGCGQEEAVRKQAN